MECARKGKSHNIWGGRNTMTKDQAGRAERAGERRQTGERRKQQQPFEGPERRLGERRSGKDRRQG